MIQGARNLTGASIGILEEGMKHASLENRMFLDKREDPCQARVRGRDRQEKRRKRRRRMDELSVSDECDGKEQGGPGRLKERPEFPRSLPFHEMEGPGEAVSASA
jgi:hypothetical protein